MRLTFKQKSRKIEKKKEGGGVSFLIFLIKKTFGGNNAMRKCLIKALIPMLEKSRCEYRTQKLMIPLVPLFKLTFATIAYLLSILKLRVR